MFKKSFVFLLVAPLVFLLSCSSGDDDIFPETIVVTDEPQPIAQALSSEITIGDNRFSYFILDEEGVPVVDAITTISFYDLSDGKETKKTTLDGVSIVPARDAGIQEQATHTHADGSRHVHINAGESVGLYAVNVNFDRAGLWGAQVEVKDNESGIDDKLIMMFDVIDKGNVPNIGDIAPPSDNVTVEDVADLALIDTSTEPTTDMHTMSIADAVASGKPTVVLFAAPGYCTSRICGPEYEIMKKLFKQYRDQNINFVHVEFYQDPATPQRRPVAAANEWKLRTEPWFFVIDKSGKIAARFEGPTGLNELDAAIKKLSF